MTASAFVAEAAGLAQERQHGLDASVQLVLLGQTELGEEGKLRRCYHYTDTWKFRQVLS
jgi:hypothetical protein